MSPSSNLHGKRKGEICSRLRKRPGGVVTNACSIQTDDGVRVADVAWISNALYAQFGTQDPKMIAAARSYAAANGIPASAWEVQMLHGVRRDLQESLAREGARVRIYIPYGTEWYPYFMRRLAERPANVWFLLKNAVRG